MIGIMPENKKRRIEYMPVTELMTRLHPANPKGHDLEMIINSYQVHGFVSSGTLDQRTGKFLCGHGRTEALNQMIDQQMDAPRYIEVRADDWYCPVECGYESLNDAQALAYIAIDNQATIAGDWDKKKLAELLTAVNNSEEIELSASGFNQEQLKEIMTELANQQEPADDPGARVDKAAELQEKWQVQRGDIWQIPSASGDGIHRVMCGDSTCADDVERLMDGVLADLCFTDPPYGINIVGANGKIGAGNLAKNQTYKPIESDDTTDAARDAYLLAKEYCDEFIIWGGNYFTDFLPPRSGWVIWDKREGMSSNNFADCEIAWTSFNKPARIYRHLWNGMIRKGKDGQKVHPTQKPIDLHADLIVDYCRGKNIYDPFLGSGTTICACEQTGRTGYGMEIAPEYVAVTLQRLADMGLTPALVENKNPVAGVVDGGDSDD